MKKILFLLMALLGFQLHIAQSWTGNGDQKFESGIDIWGKGGVGIKGSYDYGISDFVSVGAGIGFFSEEKTENYIRRTKTSFSIYGRANYHLKEILDLSKKIDIYPGLSVGILGNSLDFRAYIGLRYFFTPTIGVYSEVGNCGGIGIVINM